MIPILNSSVKFIKWFINYVKSFSNIIHLKPLKLMQNKSIL